MKFACSSKTGWEQHFQFYLQVPWHEIARPQIHGFNMQCITVVKPMQYVSGADEKVCEIA